MGAVVPSRHTRALPVAVLAGAVLASAVGGAVAEEGPVVGTPPAAEAAAGWVDTYVHPDYFTSYLQDALVNGHVNLPYPTDPVKPEAYLDNVPVDPGAYTSVLPVDDRDLSELTYEWDGQTKTLDQFVRTTRTDGVVFVVDGTVIGEQYANGYGPEVRHQPWSVTKTFVAAVVGIAYDEGLIESLQDPIDAYIPELAGTAWEDVTIENLLQMESGVHWDEGTPVLVVNTQVEQWVELALDMYSQGQLGQTRNEFLAALPKAYEQGTEFRYNSGNTQVLAWLTEVLYDGTFNEVLSEKLWQPMGAAGDAVMTADRLGGVVASHGLFARPHDFARFGELLRNGGRTPEGHQVVPASWVDAMTTMTEVSDGRYGYQTWAHPIAGEGAYSASGFQGQKITVVPDACMTGVRLSYALGADVRDGEATDPSAYGFSTEFYAEEWQTLLAAVAEEHGDCSADHGPGRPGDPGRSDDAPGRGDRGPEEVGAPGSSGQVPGHGGSSVSRPPDGPERTVRCRAPAGRAHALELTVEGQPAHGLYAVPRGGADTLVVYAHGYGHSSESWRQHLVDTTARTGAAAVAMDYRGTRFVGDDDGDGVPTARGWRVAEGAADSIAAARAFEIDCGIERVVLTGVSMGGNAAGLALANAPAGRDGGPLFDWWVQVEGASNVVETYQGARLLAPANTFAANAVADIEEEMGGTFEEVPQVYADRTVVNRVDDIVASGVRGAVVVHAVEDGLVPYNQARELVAALRQAGMGTDMHTVGTRDDTSEAGTTITSYAGVDSPFAGHASERSTTHLVMRTAFGIVDRLVAGDLEPTDAEVVVDGTVPTG